MNNDPPNIDSAGDGPTHFGEEPPERDVKPERHAESGSPPENFRIPESDGELDTLRPTPRLSQFVSPGLELPPDLEREHLAVVLKAGDVVNERFEVLEMVGLGGMGAVYRVRDVLMGQTRALKVMLPSLVHSEDAQRRFMSEVSISQQLRHEGVVAVYDLGLDQVRGTRFFTMEFIEGKTLHRMLRERGGKLPPEEALKIVGQLCGVLEYAHKYTVHRDLKPQNIMVRPDGLIKVLDFGLAKLMSPGRLTRSSMALGTAYYQAPEQSIHLTELDQRADIYSVGVILYQMLTGKIPLGRVKAPSELNVQVPAALDDVVLKCIEPEPDDRYKTVGQLRTALENAQSASLLARQREEQATRERAEDERRRKEEAARKAAEEHRRAEEARKREEEARAEEERRRRELERTEHEAAERKRRETEEQGRREEEARRREEETAVRRKFRNGLIAVVLVSICVAAALAYFVQHDANRKRDLSFSRQTSPENQGVSETAQQARQGSLPREAGEDAAKKAALPPGSRAEETWTVDLGGGVSLELVWIPPGEFVMGSPSSEANRDDDETQHRVRITQGFWMGKYEVTQAQWQSVMGNNPSYFKGDRNLPVEQVSWNDCHEFLSKLNSRVSGGKFRLPTEAEWEYACRAGTPTAYHFGNDVSRLGEYAWYTDNGGSKTHPVGLKEPNAWGLYDMHGNVWEWCEDWYDDDFYSKSPGENPCNTSTGDDRVVRGGSWIAVNWLCRSAFRFRGLPTNTYNYFCGFRVVCESSR